MRYSYDLFCQRKGFTLQNYFVIYNEDEFSLSTERFDEDSVPRESLYDLYNELQSLGTSSKRTYTDGYTRTMHIELLEPVSIPLKDCDFNNANACSRGLHLGNKSFVRRNSFGNVGLMCVIDPAAVVSVPNYDSNKLRCFEYFPLCEISYNDNGEVQSPIDGQQVVDILDDCNFDLERNRKLIEQHRINNNIDLSKESDPNFLVNIINDNYSEISRNVDIWTDLLKERFVVHGEQ